MHMAYWFCIPSLLCFVGPANAQGGGGPLPAARARDEIGSEQRARIDSMLIENAAVLRESGSLPAATPAARMQTGLQWPLRPVASYHDPGYHGVGNFVD